MNSISVEKALKGNPYPGRGIILGKSEGGKNAVAVYFIMGRSKNSRNRIFLEDGDDVMIKPFDESKVSDPSLIVYYPTYKLSILKCGDADTQKCFRYFYNYEAISGTGHLIHTYETDGDPLPTFVGEPKQIEITGTLTEFADRVWNSLDEENRISLVAKSINMQNGQVKTYIINKNISK